MWAVPMRSWQKDVTASGAASAAGPHAVCQVGPATQHDNGWKR